MDMQNGTTTYHLATVGANPRSRQQHDARDDAEKIAHVEEVVAFCWSWSQVTHAALIQLQRCHHELVSHTVTHEYKKHTIREI